MKETALVRPYLRASTEDQDAERAKQSIKDFAAQYSNPIAAWYVENASGASAERAELTRLLSDANPGDVLLVESIDRLSRLPADDWERLRSQIKAKGIRVVALDLPTSHRAMASGSGDEFTDRMLGAINDMMLDMMAAIARKDYEQRRQRQAQGIETAKAKGKYKGRPKDTVKRGRIEKMLKAGLGVRETARTLGCSPATVSTIKRELAQ